MSTNYLAPTVTDPVGERQKERADADRYKDVVVKRGLTYFDDYRSGSTVSEGSGKSVWMFKEMATWYIEGVGVEFGEAYSKSTATMKGKRSKNKSTRELYPVTVVHDANNRPFINSNLDFDKKHVGFTTKYQMNQFLLYQPTLREEFTLEKLDRLMKSKGYYRDKGSTRYTIYRFNYHKHEWPFFGEDPDASADIVWLQAHLKPRSPYEWTYNHDTDSYLPIKALDFEKFFNILTLPELDNGKHWRHFSDKHSPENKKKMLKKHMENRKKFKEDYAEIFETELAEILEEDKLTFNIKPKTK